MILKDGERNTSEEPCCENHYESGNEAWGADLKCFDSYTSLTHVIEPT